MGLTRLFPLTESVRVVMELDEYKFVPVSEVTLNVLSTDPLPLPSSTVLRGVYTELGDTIRLLLKLRPDEGATF